MEILGAKILPDRMDELQILKGSETISTCSKISQELITLVPLSVQLFENHVNTI